MTIDQIFTPFRKWWWLILGAAILAAFSGYIVVQDQPEVYEARALLMVGTVIADPNPSSGDIYLNQQLAGIYAEIGNGNTVLDQVKNELGLERLPEFSIRAIPNSQFIEIVVVDTLPERARAVANEIGLQIINRSPTSGDNEDPSRQAFIEEQLTYLETKIDEAREEVASTQLRLADLKSALEISKAQTDINNLQAKILSLQSAYAAMLERSRGDASNRIFFVEEANLPSVPSNRNDPVYIGLSGTLGLLLGVGGAIILERLDRPNYSYQNIETELSFPIFGSIPNSYELFTDDGNTEGVFVLENPSSPLGEAFHLIRAHLQSAWGEIPPKTLLITSFNQGAGKTTIAENLAAAFAKSGVNITLIDADFRRSSLHTRFGLPEGPGLVEIIEENLSPDSLAHPLDDSRFNVVTSGTKDVDPVTFFSSLRFLTAVGKFKSSSSLAIFDGPPTFVSDTFIMAAQVDGVIIIVNPDDLQLEQAKIDLGQLQRSGAKILGLILNNVRKGEAMQYSELTKHQYLWRSKEEPKEADHIDKGIEASSDKVPPFKGNDFELDN